MIVYLLLKNNASLRFQVLIVNGTVLAKNAFIKFVLMQILINI